MHVKHNSCHMWPTPRPSIVCAELQGDSRQPITGRLATHPSNTALRICLCITWKLFNARLRNACTTCTWIQRQLQRPTCTEISFFWPVASSSSGMPVLLINPASPFRLSQDPEARIVAWICDIDLHSKLSGSRYCCGWNVTAGLRLQTAPSTPFYISGLKSCTVKPGSRKICYYALFSEWDWMHLCRRRVQSCVPSRWFPRHTPSTSASHGPRHIPPTLMISHMLCCWPPCRRDSIYYVSRVIVVVVVVCRRHGARGDGPGAREVTARWRRTDMASYCSAATTHPADPRALLDTTLLPAHRYPHLRI